MNLVNVIAGPIISAILFLLKIYSWILIIAIFLSWVRPDPYNPIVRFLNSITGPVFYKTRQLLPFLRIGMIDLSPIAVFIFIRILQGLLIFIARNMGIIIR